MGKVNIITDAFNQLYADLGNDLSSFLTQLVNTGTKYDYKTAGKQIGNRWNINGFTLLLQIDPRTELDVVLKYYKNSKGDDVRLADRYFDRGNLIEYKASSYPGSSFLLTTEVGGGPHNGPICDVINSFALGGKPYISDVAKETLLKPGRDKEHTSSHGLSKKTSAPKPRVVREPDPKEEDDDNTLPLNLILYGPPGTGKTYNTIFKTLDILEVPVEYTPAATKTNPCWFDNVEADRDKALEIFNELKEDGRIVFTTFHQSMSYEDFIEGIKPDLTGTSLHYKIEDGLFKLISDKAAGDSQNNYVLIIDEINRGNVANIFGELITLIEDDKRTTKFNKDTGLYERNPEGIIIKLPYSKTKDFGVPGNLYIIGTMNTADRSVEALDSALRRRFSFVEMMPKPELLDHVKIEGIGKTLEELLSTINKRIEVLKDREHQIGHSYFMMFVKKDPAGIVVNSTASLDDLKAVFTDKIIPLLQEYFYGDYEKIQLVLGDGFVKDVKVTPGTHTFAAESVDVEMPEKIYNIEKNPVMDEALKKLLNL